MKHLLPLFIVFFISFNIFAQQNTFILTNTTDEFIGKQVSILKDPIGNLTIEDVQKPENQAKFVSSEKDILRFENIESSYWVRIDLNNQSERKDWVLEIAEAKIEFTDLFVQNEAGKWTEIKNGYNLPMSQKYKHHYYQLFPLHFYKSQAVFYVRIKGTMNAVPIKILHNEHYEINQIHENFIYGLYYGIILFIFFNNLAFGLLTRNKTYLIYTGLVMNYIIVSLYDGYIRMFFDKQIDLMMWVSFLTISNIIFMVLYAKSFLNVQNRTKLGKTLNLYTLIIVICCLVSFFIASSEVFILAQILLPIAFLLVIFTAIVSLKKEGQFAVYYLVTFAIFAFFVFLEIFYINTGTPKYFIYLPHSSWGVLSEVIILAYALNRRFDFEQKQLQKAKETAQKEMIEQVKENARLVEEQNEVLEEKVKGRTAELYQTNEELSTTNEELQQTQEEILAQRDLLEQKNDLLEEYTYKIGKSIGAAQIIQKAILPPKDKMKNMFQEHFVLFMPRDVVSGDFWWANEIAGEKYLIVADCTGHGVSGALLTMIGSALLDRIIRLMGITEPAQILEKLHEEIQDVLQQDQTKNNEGMDIAVVHWHYENEECFLSFAAAKRPLFYAHEGSIEKISGTRRHIGGIGGSLKSFENRTFTLPKGTCLYLCSDGYNDQNNIQRLSFSEKGLINLLQEIQYLPMEEQKEILKEQLLTHMQGTEQRDDILVVGVRL